MNFDKMATMTAVFLDYNTIGPDDLDPSPLIDCLPDIEFYGSTTPDELKDRIQNAEFILTNKVKLDTSNLEGAKKLKFIGLTATGADNIDLDYVEILIRERFVFGKKNEKIYIIQTDEN